MRFLQNFTIDNEPSGDSNEPFLDVLEEMASGAKLFLSRYTGCSFSNGVYRIHEANKIRLWTGLVWDAFPSIKGQAISFSSDWLGRQFAIKLGTEKFSGQILMMEPGTGKVLNVENGFFDFHNQELVDHKEAALAFSSYREWLLRGCPSPRTDQCIGYKKPLFLGGADVPDNLELADMEIYWSLSAQLLSEVRKLAPGTYIEGFDIR